MIKGADGHVATIGLMAERSRVTTSASYLMMKAGMFVGRDIDAALAASDLTSRQFLLLAIVAEHQAESQQEISRIMHLDPTLVVGVIDDLEQRGLVSRSRQPEDRRRIGVSLTPEGARRLASATSAVGAAESEFLGPLPAAERSTFRRLLAKVMADKLAG